MLPTSPGSLSASDMRFSLESTGAYDTRMGLLVLKTSGYVSELLSSIGLLKLKVKRDRVSVDSAENEDVERSALSVSPVPAVVGFTSRWCYRARQ
ncbi:hypothetical protein R1flu_026916 [Riccia fluitans]|uniref:Uncharacterized protein n=1 Tax=Riccia fluitans TaxID=41844 RepID=A0ABD1XI15_9MARC